LNFVVRFEDGLKLRKRLNRRLRPSHTWHQRQKPQRAEQAPYLPDGAEHLSPVERATQRSGTMISMLWIH
jgi:hypothetical protein